jgi:hypothetical protein
VRETIDWIGDRLAGTFGQQRVFVGRPRA